MKVLFLRDARPYFLLFAVALPIAAVCTVLALFAVPSSLFPVQFFLAALALLAGSALVLTPLLLGVFRFWGLLTKPHRTYELTLPVSCRAQLALRFLLCYLSFVLGAVVLLACACSLVQLFDLNSLVGASLEDILSAVYGFLSSEPVLVLEVVVLLLFAAAFEVAFLFAVCAVGQYVPASRGVMAVLLYCLCAFFVFPFVSSYFLLPLFLYIGAWSLPVAGLLAILFYCIVDALLLYFVYVTLSRRLNVR